SQILVTGASGFVASWVVKESNSRGYLVRGIVRSAAKGEHLKELFGGQFEYVIVEDVPKNGTFDEAVKDVDAVVHTASPVTFDVQDPQKLIGPAVGGTLSILRSILKNGHTCLFSPRLNVKRVVITSSFGAIVPKTYDESVWNNNAVDIADKEGCRTHPGQIYRASKVLAEKAAWEFVDSHKDEIDWYLITLFPSLIFGPIIHEVHKDLISTIFSYYLMLV
ncbi:hypothetical protein M422DRAFT_150365, partial [Sphaerobolus stellatus SS14]